VYVGDGGAGGPFAHYPGNPGTMEAAAGSVHSASSDVEAVGASVSRAAASGATEVDGLLLAPLQAAPLPVQRQTTDLTRAAVVVAGAVTAFSFDVTDFNTRVDRLNERWAAAASDGFGVDEPSLAPDATPQERRTAGTEHDQAVGG